MTIDRPKLERFFEQAERALLSKGRYACGNELTKLNWLKECLPKQSGIGLAYGEERDLKLIASTSGITLDIFED